MRVETHVELIRSFVNTRDVEQETDALDSPVALVDWLGAHGLADPDLRAGAADLRRARALREALRGHLLANNGAALRTADVDTLDRQARRSRVGLAFTTGGARLEPRASGIDGALGRLLVAVHDAVADGSWRRLKACSADPCGWAFVDRSRNASRHWCSMRVCGNREKARAFRARHAARPA